jgi:hypothetical protein
MSTDYQWESNAQANIKVQVPTSWNRDDVDGGRGFKIKSPDSAVVIEFLWITHGAKEVAPDEHKFLAMVQTQLTDVKVTRPPHGMVQHGLPAFGLGGTGRLKEGGNELNWFTLSVGDGNGHGVLVMSFSSPLVAAHVEELKVTLGSLQPIVPPSV